MPSKTSPLERGISKPESGDARKSEDLSFIGLVNVNGLMKEQGPSDTSTDTKAGNKKNDRQFIANHLWNRKDTNHVCEF